MFRRTIAQFVLLIVFSAGTPALSETLDALEAITARYATLASFLADEDAVLEYREALKAYMGEGKEFDKVYDEFIRQIREVNEKVAGFGEKAWSLNKNWRESGFTLEGEFSGSGLDVKREFFLEQISSMKKNISDSLPQGFDSARVAQIVAQLKQEYQLLNGRQQEGLSRSQLKSYQARLAGDKKNSIPSIYAHPKARELAQYLASIVLEHDERLGDALHSGDADIMVRALSDLESLSGFEDTLKAHGIEVPEEVLMYLRFSNPVTKEIKKAYSKGIASMKEFRHIADPRLDPQILQRMQEIVDGGVAPEEAYFHLNEEERNTLTSWQMKRRQVNSAKQEFAESFNKSSEYFGYTLHEDPHRHTLRLKADTKSTLHFRQTPRAFHAFFAGRKTGECVGGRDCANLVPKRWARAALDGAESYFTETENRRMEGMIGLTRLTRVNQSGQSEFFDVVDLMSNAIKGDIVVRDKHTGRLVKYSFFDRFIDKMANLSPTARLIISDGNNISQNVSGAEVVLYSPAYLENKVVGHPNDFAPFDPMADEISEKFPKTMQNYGDGGMIYDGMRGDGTKVVRLVPSSERRKWTKRELEQHILRKLWFLEEVNDEDVVWKRAMENGVVLQRVGYYRAQLESDSDATERSIMEFLKEQLSEEAGGVLASEAMVNLARAIELNPHETDHVTTKVLQAVKNNLNVALGEGNANAENAAYFLRKAIEVNPLDKRLRTPDFIDLLIANMKRGGSSLGAQSSAETLAVMIAAHPEELSSRTTDIVAGLEGMFGEETTKDGDRLLLGNLIKAYPNSTPVRSLVERLFVRYEDSDSQLSRVKKGVVIALGDGESEDLLRWMREMAVDSREGVRKSAFAALNDVAKDSSLANGRFMKTIEGLLATAPTKRNGDPSSRAARTLGFYAGRHSEQARDFVTPSLVLAIEKALVSRSGQRSGENIEDSLMTVITREALPEIEEMFIRVLEKHSGSEGAAVVAAALDRAHETVEEAGLSQGKRVVDALLKNFTKYPGTRAASEAAFALSGIADEDGEFYESNLKAIKKGISAHLRRYPGSEATASAIRLLMELANVQADPSDLVTEKVVNQILRSLELQKTSLGMFRIIDSLTGLSQLEELHPLLASSRVANKAAELMAEKAKLDFVQNEYGKEFTNVVDNFLSDIILANPRLMIDGSEPIQEFIGRDTLFQGRILKHLFRHSRMDLLEDIVRSGKFPFVNAEVKKRGLEARDSGDEKSINGGSGASAKDADCRRHLIRLLGRYFPGE